MKKNKKLYYYLSVLGVLVFLILWNRNSESRWEKFIRINKLDKEELPFFDESGEMNSGGDARWNKAIKIASQLRSGVDKKEDILKIFGHTSLPNDAIFHPKFKEKGLIYSYISNDMSYNKKENSKNEEKNLLSLLSLVLIFDTNGYFVLPDTRIYYIPAQNYPIPCLHD